MKYKAVVVLAWDEPLSNNEVRHIANFKREFSFDSRVSAIRFMDAPLASIKELYPFRSKSNLRVDSTKYFERVYSVSIDSQNRKHTHATNQWDEKSHVGFCKICGRMLIDPESVTRRIGPECWKEHCLANLQ